MSLYRFAEVNELLDALDLYVSASAKPKKRKENDWKEKYR